MIHLDLTNTSTDRIGPEHGLDQAREQQAYAKRLDQAASQLRANSQDPERFLGWIDLPSHNPSAERIKHYADRIDASLTDLLVLGIGGSSLGAMCVTTALQHPFRHLQTQGTGLRVHFLDNVDPDVVQGLLEVLDPRTTLVNVISKSGTTAETMAGYLAVRQWLHAALGADHTHHIVATTDPAQGILRPLAAREGYETFTVPPNVGGRFSVLSAVGLLPIALAGIDITAMLKGAADANALIAAPTEKNPIKQATLTQYLNYRRGKIISVIMPYSTRLRYLADWYVQLWAESLGKAHDIHGSTVHEGSTPLGAIGATDQHSQVQLFNEGPHNKLITFVRIGTFDHEVVIPEVGEGLEKLAYLGGQQFNQLISAEQSATAYALASHQRPNYTWTLERLDAYHLGMFLQMLEWQTALMGELTQVDTYNQPGVELGKIYTYALMGRSDFEAQRQELEAAGVTH